MSILNANVIDRFTIGGHEVLFLECTDGKFCTVCGGCEVKIPGYRCYFAKSIRDYCRGNKNLLPTDTLYWPLSDEETQVLCDYMLENDLVQQ